MKKNRFNRKRYYYLSDRRIIDILALTHRIEDAELRNEIVEQLMGGR